MKALIVQLTLMVSMGWFAPVAGIAGVASKVFLIGDSTVKNGRGDGSGGLWGWGDYLEAHFDPEKLQVKNHALGGRSSRTYLTEGRWEQVLQELRPGDFVMMQFGHNDGGELFKGNRPRASLKGNGEETREGIVELTGKPEVVHTYGWHLRRYISDAQAKGATPLVLSPVPRNLWRDGKVARASQDYGKWAREAAEQASALFLDLNELAAQRYEADGQDKVRTDYFTAADHTHTTKAGAMINAACVVQGLQGLSSDSVLSLQAARVDPAAPKPLYRDPVYDGAADPVVIWNRAGKKWFMLYTNRRANQSGLRGVSWVHGTKIGIAESEDAGVTWTYRGTTQIPLGTDDDSHWAPDVVYHDGLYHMFLSFVPGMHEDWGGTRFIHHLTSTNLIDWIDKGRLDLASNRVIDAGLLQMPNGTWRMWYNNEPDRKAIYLATSPDLNQWTDRGKVIGDKAGEGPKVFRWKGKYWMIVDQWEGLGVYRSDDADHWERQPNNILATPGTGADDQVKGGHADVVVSADRAYLFYFTHPGRRGPDAGKDRTEQRRSSIQVVELEVKDGWLTCDRDKPTRIRLEPPSAGSGDPATQDGAGLVAGGVPSHGESRTLTSRREASKLTAYPNPLIEQRADPWIWKHLDGDYYFIATVPEYDRIELRRAQTIAGLRESKPNVIWRKHDQGPMSWHIWAPELHYIDSKWYIYFAAGKAEAIWEIRMYVLENAAANPLEGEWIEKGQLQANWESFSLDATTFEHRGQRYLVWAQKDPQIKGNSNLYIAEMANPWTIKGQQARLTRPEFPWEQAGYWVNEGPAVLVRNGRIFLSYSASATDHHYCMGLLTASEEADLLDAKSWTKSTEPVFKSSPAHSQFGPGHNCFTMAEDGKTDLLVYHARSYQEIKGNALSNPDRHTRVQVLNWNPDGAPDFGEPRADTLFGQSAIPAQTTVHVEGSGKPISPDLFGIFFEDINYAADGGLYAELVQNRSFEYTPGDNRAWNSLTAWTVIPRGTSKGQVTVESAEPLNANNPHYAVLTLEPGGEGVGLSNEGFDGIVLKSGDPYDLSLFARQLSGKPARLKVILENKEGRVLAETTVAPLTRDWAKYTAVVQVEASDSSARLVLLAEGTGSIAVDMISLFPQKTFRHRPNGLRADLAQVIADLQPKFVRFPGGCLVHGDGLGNMYRWKDTIGPVEQRQAQRNIWRYHQTVGLGYFEYFQFCEDIGAKPLPVVPAGVCCQNAGRYLPGAARGQQGVPLNEMPQYIQEVLDLIEWANGPATSEWGSKRAAAGHPESFGLQYLGVGNEDEMTSVFRERYQMIHGAVKARYPEIIVIGTVGPFPDGQDFEAGWKIANEQKLEMVDEHYYRPPAWFWGNLERYDTYDRAESKVYAGEYAAHDTGRRNTLRSALAEAAYLTSLERNGDVTWLSSYAPLLAKQGRTQWRPDLIYFDNTRIVPSINYHAQQLFSRNAGDLYLPCRVVEQTSPAPANEPQPASVFLGAWNTQAEFDDVRVTAGSSVLIEETFAGSAENWRPEAGAWEIADGTYRQRRNHQPAISRWSSPARQSDYTVALRARKTGGEEGFLIGFGAVDPENYYWWNLGGWGNGRHAVEKSIGGNRSITGPSVPGKIESNRWYDIKIEVSGKRIKCYLDDVVIHDFADQGRETPADFAVSTVRNSETSDVIVKIVNGAGTSKPVQMVFPDEWNFVPTATKTVLTGDPMAVNSFEDGIKILPETSSMEMRQKLNYSAPAHSLTVIRIKTR